MNTIEGYAAVFNRPSEGLLDKATGRKFAEVIQPGAFRDWLKGGADVKALVSHDTALIIGSTKSGTLKLWEDSVGLRFTCMIDPEITYAADLYKAILRGDVKGCSFSIYVPAGGDKWVSLGAGFWRRDVYKIECREISITGFPAYPDTIATVRYTPSPVSPSLPKETRDRLAYVASLKAEIEDNTLAMHQKTVELLKRQIASGK